MKASKLIVFHMDDNELILDEVNVRLIDLSDYTIKLESFSNPSSFIERLDKGPAPHLILLDYELNSSSIDGVDLVKICRKKFSNCTIIMLTSHGANHTILNSIAAGADEFLSKDVILLDECRSIILEAHNKACFKRNLLKNDQSAVKFFKRPPTFVGETLTQLIGKVPLLLESLSNVVLIEGEPGVGKTLLSQIIEAAIPLNVPCHRINCNSLDETSIDLALFGHRKGLQGEKGSKTGLLEQSKDGYVIIEEPASLSHNAQASLVDFLGGDGLSRRGKTCIKKINVKVIFISKTPIDSLLKNKALLPDLYEKLQNARIVIPPFRDRSTKEKVELIHHFASNIDGNPIKVDQPATEILMNYSWGLENLRELKSVIFSMTSLQYGNYLTPLSIPEHILRSARSKPNHDVETSLLPTFNSTSDEVRIMINDKKNLNFNRYADQLFIKLIRIYHEELIESELSINHTKIAQILKLSRPTVVNKLKDLLKMKLITKQEYLKWKGN